jgi:hypothetical protein
MARVIAARFEDARPPARAGGAYTFAGDPAAPVPQANMRIDWLDIALVCLFLFGIYTTYTINLSDKLPVPSAPSGVAGLVLLWRRRVHINSRALGTLLVVLLVYLVSILVAPDISFLPRRLNGFVQLTYSLVIGYGLFLTLVKANARQVSTLFLVLTLVLLIGCLLETYGGLRPLSDAVRARIYPTRGLYENDLRDLIIYNRVRPKFFASEPSSVTFCFSVFAFIWLVTSRWRFKFPLYLGLLGVGVFAMPGPTVLLLLLLVLPFMLFLDSRRGGRLSVPRFLQVGIVALLCAAAFVMLAPSLFKERVREIEAGNDPSFFYRVQGPALAAITVMRHHPVTGAGLTGEPFIESDVLTTYVKSPHYSMRWVLVTPATELLINYFWLHWIYLGAVFGLLAMLAVTRWLVVLGVPSPAFCWVVWAILGQASGAYVGPACWAILYLAGAAAILHQRPAPVPSRVRATRTINLPTRLDRLTVRYADRA